MGGEERLEVAATKAKRERWLSTVCKAEETEERAWKHPRRTTDTLNYHFNIREQH